MKVSGHAKASALLGIAMYGISGSVTGGLSCFISGVLVDVDHMIDYMVNYRISLRSFFDYRLLRGMLFDSSEVMGRQLREWRRDWNAPLRSIVVFHSIEIVFIILTAFYLIGQSVIGLSLAVGIIGHLVSDYATWGRGISAFSLIGRAFHSFNLDEEYSFKQRLKKIGVDINRCYDCGHSDRTEVHWEGTGMSYKTAPLNEFEVLCPKCHDKRHCQHS